MIHFKYEDPSDQNPVGRMTITLDHTAGVYYSPEQFPLRVLHKTLSGEVIWSSDLHPGSFSSMGWLAYVVVEVIDSIGNKIADWKWDTFIHGDIAHQMFEIWSMNNRGSNGIAIGTHNGMTGEWVGPINKGLIKGTLVEGSEPQFKELCKYYSGKKWIDCIHELVTTDGEEVTFYEAGAGWINSVVKDNVEKFGDLDSFKQSRRNSISINDLIRQVSVRGPVKWIHLDVEGLDDRLIMSIEEDFLPEILVYENEYPGDRSKEVRNYLESKGYMVTDSNMNAVAYRKK